ncbi:hypothetical protein PGT21_020867 [Puccinia graminis f. sp. tritici]|uniref:Uncharacterized protein n=1 Tax=Puccinia graminis f. sp. tritici TaxID=56615 RepID=A0A5B0RI08_PUCGR|nr:hypothetical protein PGT21_020867 [Puccinia graminis f. sp. tritici]KAA1124555.1 hypothetical protein PGTUg99_015333 [Puccinia graminis f. sp. tritici]
MSHLLLIPLVTIAIAIAIGVGAQQTQAFIRATRKHTTLEYVDREADDWRALISVALFCRP